METDEVRYGLRSTILYSFFFMKRAWGVLWKGQINLLNCTYYVYEAVCFRDIQDGLKNGFPGDERRRVVQMGNTQNCGQAEPH